MPRPRWRRSLPFCGLQGMLPAGLSQLDQLNMLDLSHNAFSGGVPAGWTAVGAFLALETLNLGAPPPPPAGPAAGQASRRRSLPPTSRRASLLPWAAAGPRGAVRYRVADPLPPPPLPATPAAARSLQRAVWRAG